MMLIYVGPRRALGQVETAPANPRRRCYVIRPLLDGVCDRDRRPDLCRPPAARTHPLDCGGRGCTVRDRDSDRCKGDASERSCGIGPEPGRRIRGANACLCAGLLPPAARNFVWIDSGVAQATDFAAP